MYNCCLKNHVKYGDKLTLKYGTQGYPTTLGSTMTTSTTATTYMSVAMAWMASPMDGH